MPEHAPSVNTCTKPSASTMNLASRRLQSFADDVDIEVASSSFSSSTLLTFFFGGSSEELDADALKLLA